MAIKWTPWFNVPMHRRLELLGVVFYMFCGIFLGAITSVVMLYLLFAGNWYWKGVCVLYLTFLYYDWDTPNCGGRGAGVKWVRAWGIWKHCINYFPIDLVKTVDLTPDRNYMFCVFPHGTLSIGAAAQFGTSHSKWSSYFPGIRPKLMTLRANLLLPLQREILMSLGISAATENSLTTLLSQSNDPHDECNRDGYTSNGVGLICGGMRESFVPTPNRYQCVINKRRGFARIALKTGAALVPVISFGETNIYDIIEHKSGSWGRRIEDWLNQNGKYPGHLNGRGFLQYNFGLLPKRHPINTVVGPPIHFEKISNPSQDEIDQVHKLFCTRLKELFEEHKHKYYKESDKVIMELI